MLTESPSKPIDYFAQGLTESLDLTAVPQIGSHLSFLQRIPPIWSRDGTLVDSISMMRSWIHAFFKNHIYFS